MNKFLFHSSLILVVLTIVFSCKKKEEAATTNIATEVVSNLSTISTSYAPASLKSVSASSVSIQADPCAGVTDFAICQSNLIREYMKIAKDTVDSISTIANNVGAALGQVPDNNNGTSNDGKISWNKTSSTVWSILSRGTGGQTLAYFSVNAGVYTLKFDKNRDETTPVDQQIDVSVNFTSSDNWTVDVYFGNNVCDAADVKRPSKAHIKVSKTGALWTGKAMLYVPRWQAPGATAPTCATTAGLSEITMYTDFVGNDTSTKAALYLIPTSENDVNDITNANYSLPQFCTHYATSCDGGPGELPNATALNTYTNNWCTTGAGTSPTWGNNCTSNTAVSGAAYSNISQWTAPNLLKTKTVTMPASL